MKKVNHWINGKNVAGNDYFQTTNPATGEVLADVASGGEAEINQAVAAAKEAFPKWANLPMKERARLMRRLGDLIDQNVPEIAAMETADTGLPIHQTKNVLIPRASHNFEFFRILYAFFCCFPAAVPAADNNCPYFIFHKISPVIFLFLEACFRAV